MAKREALHDGVKRRIAEALRDGRWRHGQAIPSEPQLAHRFGVSIGTVRRAVGELVAENILDRQQGRGTFVVSHTRDYMLNVFFPIADRSGRKEFPQSEVLEFSRGRADASAAERLGIARGSPVFRIVSRLSLQGAPVILDELRLPAALFADLNAQIFGERDTSLYGLFQGRYGITVVRTVETIEAAIADERTRALLNLSTAAAVLRVVRTAYTYRGQAVETRVRFVNTARHQYLNVLGTR